MNDKHEWLALGAEKALEPELEICDPHHHLWVHPGSVYLVDDFLADAAGGHRFVSSVFVECLQFYRTDGPEELRCVGETEYVDRATADSLNGPTRVAAGIVAMGDLRRGSAVQAVLDAHAAASPRFRGIRFATSWDPSDDVHNGHTRPRQGELLTAELQAGLACVQRSGLSFDAWMYFHQLPELLQVARAFPELPIVLDHVGGPIGIGPHAGRREAVFAEWRAHIAALAECPNVCVKLGGLAMTMAGFGWHKRPKPATSEELAAAWTPYFHACIESFGVERCMFESNFPVDAVACSYTVLWNAFKRFAADFSAAEKQQLFHDTAARFYRL